jgi:hypothetical protein
MKSAASLRLPPKFFNSLDYKGFRGRGTDFRSGVRLARRHPPVSLAAMEFDAQADIKKTDRQCQCGN